MHIRLALLVAFIVASMLVSPGALDIALADPQDRLDDLAPKPF